MLDAMFHLVWAKSQRRQFRKFVEELRVDVDQVDAIAVSRKDLAGDSRIFVEV